MKIYKNFRFNNDLNESQKAIKDKLNVIYICDENGADWYSISDSFKEENKYLYVVIDADGVVISFDSDCSKLFPIGNSLLVIETDKVPTNLSIDGRYYFDDGSFFINNRFIQKMNELKKSYLKSVADKEIEWRRDAVEIGVADSKDISMLKLWVNYRVSLMKVPVSDLEINNLPQAPA